jgi:hypothetical protein
MFSKMCLLIYTKCTGLLETPSKSDVEEIKFNDNM